MDLSPRLVDVAVPEDPAGVVLVLHGGASRRRSMAVSPAQLSVLRMVPIARAAARAGDGRLAVFRLLNSRRGWDAHHTPVDDAAWALDEIETRLGARLPTCLIGHSLGGRAALLSAAAPGVRAVAALAPWVYPDDVAPGLDGQAILIVHGTLDRIASPQRSRALAANLAARTPTTFDTVDGGKHAMLSHHRAFTQPAADLARGALLGEPRTDVVRDLLARTALVRD